VARSSTKLYGFICVSRFASSISFLDKARAEEGKNIFHPKKGGREKKRRKKEK